MDRQSFLAIILPALVAATIYAIFFGLPGQLAWEKLRERSATKEERASARDFAVEIKRKGDAEEAVKALKIRRQAALAARDGGRRHSHSTWSRAETLERVTQVFTAQGLGWLGDAPLERGSVKLPLGLRDIEKSRQGGGEPLWEIRVTGNFMSMREALGQLSDHSIHAIPFGLKMRLRGELPSVWTLQLWMEP